jgi:site-specific DNA recombinase
MKTAIIYCRVSTGKQALEGVSLEAQQSACEDLCKRNKWDVAGVFVERGVSGKRKSNRPQLAAAMKAVCESQGVLVFYSLSRLARSLKDTLDIASQVQECGGSLVGVTDSIDTTTAAGRVFFAILAAFAQFESEVNGERVRLANAHIVAEKGFRTMGMQAFGWRYDKELDELVKVPEEQELIKLAKRAYKQHGSFKKAASYLNQHNVPAPSKLRRNLDRPWHHEELRRIVRG